MLTLKKIRTGALTVVALAAMVLGTSLTAHAAYEDVRPGANSPEGLTSNSNWRKAPEDSDRIAQPFIQPETGNLISFTIDVNGGEGLPYDFSAAAIHEFTAGDGPASTPLDGGIASITFAEPAEDTGVVKAVLTFDDKPLLTEGASYAVVINPTTVSDPTQNASFPTHLQWNNANSELYVWNIDDGVWAGFATAFTIFESQLVTYVDAPETDTPSTTPTAPTPPKRIQTGA